MKKWVFGALLALMAYLGSLMLTLPAARLLQWLLPPNSRIEQPLGNLMEGWAGTVSWQHLELTKLHWQLDPWQLLLGRLALTVEFSGMATGQGTLMVSPWGWQLRQWVVSVPAARLASLMDIPLPLTADGEVRLQLQQAALGQPVCKTLQGQAQWLNPQLTTPLGPLSLQPLLAKLHCDHGIASARLDHQGSQLKLLLDGHLNVSQWQLSGQLKGGRELSVKFQRLLHYLGQADGNGYYHFSRQGSWQPFWRQNSH